MSCGIYKITNNINQLSYIGQSIDIKTRWVHHKNYPKRYSHYPLYQDFEKYGIDNFTFSILEECDLSQLDDKEQYYIMLYDTYNHGYNQTRGGSAAGHIMKISCEDLLIIYDLLQNSSILQNDIAKMFNVGADTISEINQGKTRTLPNYTYPLRNNRRFYFCPDCGQPVTQAGARCIKCRHFADRKVERPSREELKKLIRTTPFTTIGKQFNVVDNTIRKWCIAENLPSKSREIKQYTDKEWELL